MRVVMGTWRASALVLCVCQVKYRIHRPATCNSPTRLLLGNRVSSHASNTDGPEKVESTPETEPTTGHTKTESTTLIGQKAQTSTAPEIDSKEVVEDRMADISRILGTYRHKENITWTTAEAANTKLAKYSCPEDLLGSAHVRQVVEGFAYINGSFKFRITTNAGPFHSGMLRATYLHLPNLDPNINKDVRMLDPRLSHLRGRWQTYGKTLNLSQSNVMELIIPHAHVEHYFSLTDTPAQAGVFYLENWTQLGGPGDITIKVEVAWVNARVSTPIPRPLSLKYVATCPTAAIGNAAGIAAFAQDLLRHNLEGRDSGDIHKIFEKHPVSSKMLRQLQPQMEVLGELGSQIGEHLITGTAASLIGNALNPEQTLSGAMQAPAYIPDMAGMAEKLQQPSWIRGFLNGALDFLGLSKPNEVYNVVIENDMDLFTTDGPKKVIPLGNSINDGVARISKGEQMLFKNILKRYGYFGSFNWATDTAVGSFVAQFYIMGGVDHGKPVNLTEAPANENGRKVLSMDLFEYILLGFDGFVADMEIKMTVIASKNHSGMLRVCYIGVVDGNVETISDSVCEQMMLKNIIWDITTSKSITFTVPMNVPKIWLRRHERFGRVEVYVHTPLVAPGDASNTVQLLVERRPNNTIFMGPGPPFGVTSVSISHDDDYRAFFPVDYENVDDDSFKIETIHTLEEPKRERPFRIRKKLKPEYVQESDESASIDLELFELDKPGPSGVKKMWNALKGEWAMKPQMEKYKVQKNGQVTYEGLSVGSAIRSVAQVIKKSSLYGGRNTASAYMRVDPFVFAGAKLEVDDNTIPVVVGNRFVCDNLTWYSKIFAYYRGSVILSIQTTDFDNTKTVGLLYGTQVTAYEPILLSGGFFTMPTMTFGPNNMSFHIPYTSSRLMWGTYTKLSYRHPATEAAKRRGLPPYACDLPAITLFIKSVSTGDIAVARSASDDFEFLIPTGPPPVIWVDKSDSNWYNKQTV